MDKETLRLFFTEFIELVRKEGQSISLESFFSNVGELLKAIEPAKPPTPVLRHEIDLKRHIEDACKERDRMAGELKVAHESHAAAIRELRRELTLVIDSHRDRLDWIEPQYEGLKRDYDNIKSLNFSSLFMITVGGVVIGSASFLTGNVLKFSALAAGAVATAYGLWTQGLVVYKSPASKERPAVR